MRSRFFVRTELLGRRLRPRHKAARRLILPADCAELPIMTERLAKADKILHDWPNLARYAEGNAALAASAKFELRVVFMGDSITDAWVSPQYGGFFPGKPYV